MLALSLLLDCVSDARRVEVSRDCRIANGAKIDD
jgi:hypothetical protein